MLIFENLSPAGRTFRHADAAYCQHLSTMEVTPYNVLVQAMHRDDCIVIAP